GRPITGANGIAGEWGHTPLPWPQPEELPGPPCYCGRAGCIETWLSGPGLVRDHETGGGRSNAPPAGDDAALSGEAIVARAEAEDPRAVATLARYCDRLARGLAIVLNILDPQV